MEPSNERAEEHGVAPDPTAALVLALEVAERRHAAVRLSLLAALIVIVGLFAMVGAAAVRGFDPKRLAGEVSEYFDTIEDDEVFMEGTVQPLRDRIERRIRAALAAEIRRIWPVLEARLPEEYAALEASVRKSSAAAAEKNLADLPPLPADLTAALPRPKDPAAAERLRAAAGRAASRAFGIAAEARLVRGREAATGLTAAFLGLAITQKERDVEWSARLERVLDRFAARQAAAAGGGRP